MSTDEGDAAASTDLKGWLMFGGFGLLWTLASGGMFTLIILASFGIIGVGNDTSDPVNLAMYGIMIAMFSPGPAMLYVGGSELFAIVRAKSRRRAFAGKPWKWTAQWDGGVVQADAASEAFWAWYGAVALGLFVGPFVAQLTVVKPDWRVVILVPLVIIDLLLFRYAWRRSRSARRYGKLGLRLSQLPLQPGATFDVLLEIPATLEGQASLRISCMRRVRTGRGKTHSETVFETTSKVPIVASGQRSIIRGSLALPDKHQGASFTWWLEVKGPELSESFELPVFEASDVERFPRLRSG